MSSTTFDFCGPNLLPPLGDFPRLRGKLCLDDFGRTFAQSGKSCLHKPSSRADGGVTWRGAPAGPTSDQCWRYIFVPLLQRSLADALRILVRSHFGSSRTPPRFKLSLKPKAKGRLEAATRGAPGAPCVVSIPWRWCCDPGIASGPCGRSLATPRHSPPRS